MNVNLDECSPATVVQQSNAKLVNLESHGKGAGLGFKRKPSDKVESRNSKNDFRKQSLESDAINSHGLVEEDIQKGSSKPKQSNYLSSKIQSKPNKKPKTVPENEKSQSKSNSDLPTLISTPPLKEVISSPLPISTLNDSIPVSSEPFKHQKLRKKTRSKQKNLRKDNRPEDQKPSYLRVGNEIYRGRELTMETKKVLEMRK